MAIRLPPGVSEAAVCPGRKMATSDLWDRGRGSEPKINTGA